MTAILKGDPRCRICLGVGEINSSQSVEACSCTEKPIRDPYKAPEIGGFGSYPAEASERWRRAEQAAIEHQRTCTTRPCRQCERFVCACGADYDGGDGKGCSSCRAKARLLALFEPLRAGLPRVFRPLFDEATVADLRAIDQETGLPRVKLAAERIGHVLARPPSKNFLIYGDTGMGKTTLAIAAFGAWARQDPEARAGARFASAYDLAGARARYPLGQGDPPEMREAKTTLLLLLDDLGNDIDDRRNVIGDVLSHRYNEDLPTWVTTGYPVEYLQGRYGVHVIRRIGERGKKLEMGE